tara:strand:- start:404 stop:535 length:132 start_codon:yes stop_codon:yes gene_type:complete
MVVVYPFCKYVLDNIELMAAKLLIIVIAIMLPHLLSELPFLRP